MTDRSRAFLCELRILPGKIVFVHPEWSQGFWWARRSTFLEAAVTPPGENHSGRAWSHFSRAACSHVGCARSGDRIWSHANSCCGQFMTTGAFCFRGKKDWELLQVLCSLWWEARECKMTVMPQGSAASVVEAVILGWASGHYHWNLSYTQPSCEGCESALKVILLCSKIGLVWFFLLIHWRRFQFLG